MMIVMELRQCLRTTDVRISFGSTKSLVQPNISLPKTVLCNSFLSADCVGASSVNIF